MQNYYLDTSGKDTTGETTPNTRGTRVAITYVTRSVFTESSRRRLETRKLNERIERMCR